jgi:hypothetical protein
VSTQGGSGEGRGTGSPGSRYPVSDFSKIRTRSIEGRPSKVHRRHLGRPYAAGSSFGDFLDGLPDVLGARDLRSLIRETVAAHRQGLPRIAMMGGHVVKCGLGPMVVQLLERGLLTGVAGNGAVAIHDVELALWGHTSEDVAETLTEGEFGMTEETAALMNREIRRGHQAGLGLGECLGEWLLREAPHAGTSILATAVKNSIPVTIHVGIGTDTIHAHPSASGEAIGATTYRDFQVFTREVEALREGSVVLNLGSAVILPEVFLKALSVARNLGRPARSFVAANFDMALHYRPRENVVRRPTLGGGRGYMFLGQHELLLPLYFAGILEATRGEARG